MHIPFSHDLVSASSFVNVTCFDCLLHADIQRCGVSGACVIVQDGDNTSGSIHSAHCIRLHSLGWIAALTFT